MQIINLDNCEDEVDVMDECVQQQRNRGGQECFASSVSTFRQVYQVNSRRWLSSILIKRS